MALRKCVSLGAGILPANDLTNPRMQRWFQDSGTEWVRIWALWSQYFPARRGTVNAAYQSWVDTQITTAVSLGLKVVLVADNYPTWVPKASGPNPAGRPLEWQFPADLTVSSEWAEWIGYLIDRYGPTTTNTTRYATFFEVCNEPNFQGWPQVDNNGTRIVQCKVGQMMLTAQTIQRSRAGNNIILAGPAFNDKPGASDGSFTNVFNAIPDLCGMFDSIGFIPDTRFVWSQHNYSDATRQRNTMPRNATDNGTNVNRAALARLQLIAWGKWAGWSSGSPAAPGILLTEGGVMMGPAPWATTEAQQASWLGNNINAMRTGATAAGIAMYSQYQFYTSSYDSGVLPPYGVDGNVTPRLSYTTWRNAL